MSLEHDPLPAPKTKADIAKDLRCIAKHMLDIATSMDYYGGFSEWSQHGKEMAMASAIAEQWADEIDAEESIV